MAGGSCSSGAKAPERGKTGRRKKTENWMAWVWERLKAEMRSPRPREQRRKRKQMRARVSG